MKNRISPLASFVIGKIAPAFVPAMFCLILVLPASIELFRAPLFVAHDYTHVGRITEMVNTLKSGQLPPRWSQNLGFGYGMPLFSFYAPLPYYLGSLFVIAGMSASMSVSLLFFLSSWGSSIVMFYLARNGSKQFLIPLASAAIFIYLPYRAVDIFVRGALGELWGIWFLAIVLLALQNLFRAPTVKRVILYALALALFFLSHNLMVLIGLPLIAVIIVVHHSKQLHAKKIITTYVLGGTLLGLGMAAYFLFPMFFEKQYTSVDTLSSVAGGYGKHFVYWKQLISSEFSYGGSIEGIYDGISFALGAAGWFIILLGLFSIVNYIRRSENKIAISEVFFWILVILTTLFFTSQKSNFIWRSFDVLSYLQFPWRFLSLMLLALPLLFLSFMKTIKSNRYKKIFSVIVSSLLLFEVKNFRPNPETISSKVASISNTEFIKTELSKTIPDYIHPDLASIVTDANKRLYPAKTRFETFPPIPLTIQKNSASIAQALIPPIDKPTIIRANIFDFPGWQWKLDGVKVAHTKATPLPVMEYLLEPSVNSRELAIVWSETPLRQVANAISVVSWIITIIYFLMFTIPYARKSIKSSQGKP